jgi:hypothetical protein
MKLNNAFVNPVTMLQYLERYVNDGSPSGHQTSTSNQTNPFGEIQNFNLYVCTAPPEWFIQHGEIPSWPLDGKSNWILIHPDMLSHEDLQWAEISITELGLSKVVPTASGRTVQFIGDHNDYVKLHYDRVLGRFKRGLPYSKAVAGPEISHMLRAAIDEKQLPPEFTFLPETGCRVMRIPAHHKEWGMIWRSSTIYGFQSKVLKAMIPFFALFSKDRLDSSDLPVIVQLINGSGISAENFLFEKIINPILDSYFGVLCKLGIQLELNAQNLLIGIDHSCQPVCVIVRDLGGSDKDITLRNSLGLENSFLSSPYKCIHRDQVDYEYRHSFMFDFKLGEYVLEPVINKVVGHYGLNISHIYDKIKSRVAQLSQDLPTDFFPENRKWYVYEKTVMYEARTYTPLSNPKFRY